MKIKSCTLFALTCIVSLGAWNTASAQVVQLPSYRNFSYQGSAWVPDGGTVSLGGGSYSATGSTSRGWGPYGPRATGGQRGATSLSASVQIIDLKAMDDAILSANTNADNDVISAESPAAQGGRSYLSGLNNTFEREVATRPNPNDYRRALAGHTSTASTAVNESQVESDIRYYLRRGKEAEKAGRILSARVYYKMAVDAMTPDMIARYKQELQKRKEAEEERRKQNRPDRIQF